VLKVTLGIIAIASLRRNNGRVSLGANPYNCSTETDADVFFASFRRKLGSTFEVMLSASTSVQDGAISRPVLVTY
jgi:hypothetical protein